MHTIIIITVTLIVWVFLGVGLIVGLIWLLSWCEQQELNERYREEEKARREQWIQATYLELIKRHNVVESDLSEQEQSNMREWAVSLAETFYDENPGDYTPETAVAEELSYV